MRSKLVFFIIGTALLLRIWAPCLSAEAQVIYAASGSTDDVQYAVDLASVGDIVQIPEGDFLFDGMVTVPAGIAIQGAGQDKTILRKNSTSPNTMFQFDGSNGEQVQFSGIKLIGLGEETGWNKGLYLLNDCKDFRIFNCTFEKFSHAGILVYGDARGVIDHNNFIDCYRPGLGYGVEVIGDGLWDDPPSYGTQDAVFIEDCYFYGCKHAVASCYGSHYVFRYNRVENTHDRQGVDAHGRTNAWATGSRTYEIYENSITAASTELEDLGIKIRGGDGVIFNNALFNAEKHIVINSDKFDGQSVPWDEEDYPVDCQVRDMYLWGNTHDGSPLTSLYIVQNAVNIIEENRDYYFAVKSGYSPYTYPHPLTLNIPISANISASPTSGQVPLTVNFEGNATGSSPPYIYSWDFGDGGYSNEQNPSHIYFDAGDYTVTLTVTDSDSNQDNDSLVINVSAVITPLVASCAASPTSGEVPLTVNFTGSATGGVLPYSYSWDFGDGTSSSEQNPTHTYSNAGDYTATLTVTDSRSSQDNDSLIINVSAVITPLLASFIASPTSGEVPLTINFTGSATGGVAPYTYSWNFGDSTSSSEQNPTHTYFDAGNYTITFTVTDSQSNQDNDSLIINVIAPTIPPYLSCSPTSLYFGATTPGNETADQYLRIINAGDGVLTWNIEDTADWLSCSPSSGTDREGITVSVNTSGLPQDLYMATITVSSPEAYNSPQYVSVNLRVYESRQESSPFGSLHTLVDGSTVSGSVPVTGWALDDIETTRVEIKRNSDPEDPPEAIGSDGLVHIEDAVFVEGTRPDVENTYPDYPLNSRAGWGYMLLTNSLPNRGNGFFTIYAFAYDASGNREEIGRKTLLCDNANRVKPFGAINTPEQEESIGGSDYISFGWALTPLPKTIPKDGSTICVWVDGVQMGEPVYNQYREDIATLYPEYNNAQGSMGYYYLDTTQYENGVHTIAWSVMDDGGEVDGIGARYFSIDNIETENAHPGPFVFKRVYQEDVEGRLRIGIKEVRRGYRLRIDNESEINKKGILEIQPEEMETRSRYRLRVNGRRINIKGILEIQPEEMETRSRYRLRADDGKDINIEDILKIQIEEMEPIRIVFEGSSEGNMNYIGWGENKANVLPIGSTLDREKGIFSWIPTPGFIGRYELYFAVTGGSYMSKPLRVIVNVTPKRQK